MKKGQAALEFLSTYGWALMIIIIMIGVLSSYLLLKPTTFISERCDFDINILCKDQAADLEGIYLSLVQTTNKPIYLEDFSAFDYTLNNNSKNCFLIKNDNSLIPFSDLNDDEKKWDPNENINIFCEFDNYNALADTLTRVYLSLIYKQELDGFTHESEGEAVLRVRDSYLNN